MINPFEGYKVTSKYGWRIHPLQLTRKFHAGIDLVKQHRAPIYAFVGGVIQFADERSGTGFGGFGNVVAIRDTNDKLHCYCHLDSILVKVGQTVERGQEIGRQGMTGTDSQGKPTATGSHLHYEIRKASSPNNGWVSNDELRCVDPTEYLIDYYKSEAHQLSVEDANKIIRFLSVAYFVVEDNKKAREEFRRLANELRLASGQTVQ